jgi:hypothetical protein
MPVLRFSRLRIVARLLEIRAIGLWLGRLALTGIARRANG